MPQHEYYLKHRESILTKQTAYMKEWIKNPTNRENRINYLKNITKERKVEVLQFYGKEKIACCICGFNDIRALSIDHINNDGYKHRKEIIKTHNLYWWLKRNGFPEGYQTLCMNCQFIKRYQKS